MATIIAQGSPGADLLFEEGAVFPVRVVGPLGSVATQAQIDNGSTISSVDAALLVQVGAVEVTTDAISTVTSSVVVPVDDDVQVLTAGGVNLAAGLPGLLADNLPPPVQVLIGRDVLSQYEFDEQGSGSWELEQEGAGASAPTPGGVSAVDVLLLSAAGSLVAFGIWTALSR